jgi:gliding motility-associated-like protein
LTINTVLIRTINATICEGQTYNFYGTPFTAEVTGHEHRFSNGIGCDSTVILNLTVRPNPTLNIIPLPALRIDATVVTLSATPAGGIFSGAGVTGATFNPSAAGLGTHTITYNYTDNNGCSNSETTTVTVTQLPSVPKLQDMNIYECQDSNIDLSSKVIADENHTLIWYENLHGSGQHNTPFIDTYSPGVYLFYVSQEDNLTNAESEKATIKVTVYGVLPPDVSGNQLNYVVDATPKELVAKTVKDEANYYFANGFEWSLENELLSYKPVVDTRKENTIRYGVKQTYLIAETGEKCRSAEKFIDVSIIEMMVIPNIIALYSKHNATFMPGYSVEIYNRYQQKVFEGNNGWDGTYRGSIVDPGTYFYRLILKDGKVVKGTLDVVKF